VEITTLEEEEEVAEETVSKEVMALVMAVAALATITRETTTTALEEVEVVAEDSIESRVSFSRKGDATRETSANSRMKEANREEELAEAVATIKEGGNFHNQGGGNNDGGTYGDWNNDDDFMGGGNGGQGGGGGNGGGDGFGQWGAQQSTQQQQNDDWKQGLMGMQLNPSKPAQDNLLASPAKNDQPGLSIGGGGGSNLSSTPAPPAASVDLKTGNADAAFLSQHFEFGKIPLIPPPEELC
jgi:hypothetical protein